MSSEAQPRDVHDEGLGPLVADEVALLERASRRARQATAAASLATFHGWTFAACALVCVPLAFADPVVLAVGVALAASAAMELHGARLLRRFEVRGARLLAMNQVALLGVVVLYCASRIWSGLTGPSLRDQLMAEVPDLGGLMAASAELSDIEPLFDHIDHIYRLSIVALYGGVIAVSALYQGACAVYYWTRAAHVSAYERETPTWVRELLARMQA
jgi:hypothetical protein